MTPVEGIVLSVVVVLGYQWLSVANDWTSPTQALREVAALLAGAALTITGLAFLPRTVFLSALIVAVVAFVAFTPVAIMWIVYRSWKNRAPLCTTWVPPDREPGGPRLPKSNIPIPVAKIALYAVYLVVPITYVAFDIAISNWRVDLAAGLSVASVWGATRLLGRRGRGEK
ncbi:MAG: hypothetical protein ACRDGS_09500 [Chloroflexota bacterium]